MGPVSIFAALQDTERTSKTKAKPPPVYQNLKMALHVLSSRNVSCGRKLVVLILENALIMSKRLMAQVRKRNT